MLRLFYMRDNHTFLSLPNDVVDALQALREEFEDRQYGPYGMLGAKGEGCRDVGHEHAGATFDEFLPRATAWLIKAVNYKTPGELEHESWRVTASA